MKKVMLYSGGCDSYLISKIYKPDLKIYVNLHTEYSESEMKKLDDDVIVIDYPFLKNFEEDNGVIPLRNLYLIMIACNYTGYDDVEICLGVNNGDQYYNDKSLEFFRNAEKFLNQIYNDGAFTKQIKNIKLKYDTLQYTKYELLKMYLKQGGDIETAYNEIFTCQHPINNEPCWNCKYCFLKFVPFYLAGYKFSNSIIQSMSKFFKEDALPKIEKGKSYYSKELLEVLEVGKRLNLINSE